MSLNCSNQLIQYSRSMIQEGSKSFSLASFFFSEREKNGSWLLYSWCRYADDLIDKAENPQTALQRLEHLERKTLLCFSSSPEHPELDAPELKGLAVIAREFNLPSKYAMDLLRGMRMDIEGRKYQSLNELIEYCYCVAGTVGLMMCHIMGISDQRALGNAVALGNAMQLTNISRDVLDDFNLGRIYFPRQWLQEFDLSELHFNRPENRILWAKLCRRLLTVADDNYNVGVQGLTYLPFRAAVAVAIAGQVYSQIGVKVLKRQELAWENRCYVTLAEKILISVRVTAQICLMMLPRMFRPWKKTPIDTIWSEQ